MSHVKRGFNKSFIVEAIRCILCDVRPGHAGTPAVTLRSMPCFLCIPSSTYPVVQERDGQEKEADQREDETDQKKQRDEAHYPVNGRPRWVLYRRVNVGPYVVPIAHNSFPASPAQNLLRLSHAPILTLASVKHDGKVCQTQTRSGPMRI